MSLGRMENARAGEGVIDVIYSNKCWNADMVEHRYWDNAEPASARGSNNLLNALDREKQLKHPRLD